MVGQILTFNQPALMKREFELISSDIVLAKMVFPKLLSSNVVVEGFDGKWEFRQLSIWRNEFGIFKYGYQMPFAKYVSNFWKSKGTIELPKGAKLNCKTPAFKRPFEIFTSSGKLILVYANRFVLKGRTTVTIQNSSELLEQYPWIIMLGWYIIFQNRRGRAAG
jgi:hypothetical protein